MSIDLLADRFQRLATSEFAGYSPLYEGLALAMASDPEALAVVEPLGDPNQTPVRLFACVHDLVLAEPELDLAALYRTIEPEQGADAITTVVWPAFRRLLFERRDDLVHAMATRSVQTNEVGRVAILVPALSEVAARAERADTTADANRQVSLVEIGPSAGLNLFVDRYRVIYSDGRSVGPEAASVELHCDVLGPSRPPLPLPAPPPNVPALTVTDRVGIDVSPLDVLDERDCRWLQACVWPGLTERRTRLVQAIELARSEPPQLHCGDALELLGPVIGSLPSDRLPIVVSTWVMAYLSKHDRSALHEVLAELGSSRDLAVITAEYPGVNPWAPEPPRPARIDEGRGATLVTATAWIDGHETCRALAWMQAHGQWIDWLESPWGDPPAPGVQDRHAS